MIDNNDEKYLEAQQLIELLSQLKRGERLYPNRVGNLTVKDTSGNYRGYIDFLLQGSLELSDS